MAALVCCLCSLALVGNTVGLRAVARPSDAEQELVVMAKEDVTSVQIEDGGCQWHYKAKGDMGADACAELCHTEPDCKVFSVGSWGCRISACGSDPGPDPCPADKQCPILPYENNQKYEMQYAKASGGCQWHYKSGGNVDAAACAELCKAEPYCKVFSVGSHGCRFSSCGTDGPPCPTDKQCIIAPYDHNEKYEMQYVQTALCRQAFDAKCYATPLFAQCCDAEVCKLGDARTECHWSGAEGMEGMFKYWPTNTACQNACTALFGNFPATDYCPGGRMEASLYATGCAQASLSLKDEQDANKAYLDGIGCADMDGGRAPGVGQAVEISVEMVLGFSHAVESPSPASTLFAAAAEPDPELCRNAWDAGCFRDPDSFLFCCPEPKCLHGGSTGTCDWFGFGGMADTFTYSPVSEDCFNACAALNTERAAVDFCPGAALHRALNETSCADALQSLQDQQGKHNGTLLPYCELQ